MTVIYHFENEMFPVFMTEDEILVEEDPDKDIFDKLDFVLEKRPKWGEDIPYRAVPCLDVV